MSIDCADSAVIFFFFFFNTSHCLFPILNENSYLPCPIGTGPGACTERGQGCGCLGKVPQKDGSVCWLPAAPLEHAFSSINAACKQCSREAGAAVKTHSGSSGCKQEEVRLGGKPLCWKGSSPETMTGRLIWWWCCSVLQAPGLCLFYPLQERKGEGGGSILTTACKYNLAMHRSARAACLLHPMCYD